MGRYKARSLMKKAGISIKPPKKFKRTTDSRHNLPVAPNLVNQQFKVDRPNRIWCGDITYLYTQEEWLYLVILIDLYSRKIVGWAIDSQMKTSLVLEALRMAYWRQKPTKGLIYNSDRGSSMTSKPVAFLLADLGITQTHSRPYVNDDNPFSESQFKTLNYQPDFPERFGSIEDSRAFCHSFFDWYNNRLYHSGQGLLIPADVHYARAEHIIKEGQLVLEQAFENHPNRFKGIKPKPLALPQAAWINKPLCCDRGLH